MPAETPSAGTQNVWNFKRMCAVMNRAIRNLQRQPQLGECFLQNTPLNPCN
jgi:hypothetical protein